MDTVTHLVLGAVIGEALAGKRLGKKAMLIGAIAQNIPDIDILASCWMDTAHDVAAHRGITHSFLFVLVLSPLLAWVAMRVWRRGQDFRSWMLFFSLQLFIHIFLDAFNAYGTGWFEPFSDYRVSFNALFVADPFYTVWLLIATLVLLLLGRNSRYRKYWTGMGLIVSTCYLYYCLLNKYRVDRWVEASLKVQQVSCSRYFTTPTPFNNWLWYVVAEDSAGYHTGYLSVFDQTKEVDFHYFLRSDSLLTAYRQRSDVKELLHFSNGYYVIDQRENQLMFNVLRFGQMRGWEKPDAGFVFHYFLQQPGDNGVILQRGRAAEWDRASFEAFVKRIKGRRD